MSGSTCYNCAHWTGLVEEDEHPGSGVCTKLAPGGGCIAIELSGQKYSYECSCVVESVVTLPSFFCAGYSKRRTVLITRRPDAGRRT